MKKKLILFNCILVITAIALTFLLGILVTRSNAFDYAEEKIKQVTEIYANTYTDDPSFVKKVQDVRVTVVAKNGEVLADSDVASDVGVENHFNREEIVAAREGKEKIVTRKSATTGTDMMYYAKKVILSENNADDYVFVRVAIPVNSVNSYVLKTIPLSLAIAFFAICCSVTASVFIGSGIGKPLEKVKDALSDIERGVYTEIPPTTDDQEVNAILAGINEVGERLEKNIAGYKGEKEKLDYILNNVSDGIVVIDEDSSILLTNGNARNIFKVRDCEGKNVHALAADQKFFDGIAECSARLGGGVFEDFLDGKWYLCSVRCTETKLTMIVLTDVTATKESEKMRLEFFANASHELKTPLTSIKGFNEMISLNTQDSTIASYSSKIGKETDRMLALLSDMLNISKLENSTAAELHPVDVDIREVSEEATDDLKMQAESKKITLKVSGNGIVHAEREHIYELVKNLAENGIRYNNEGGSVEISAQTRSDGGVRLTVRDNGIGVDPENQSRIFERFYRVDKSRSRATGGTGLGLSIVKHICDIYGASIALTSKIGVGTTISIDFKA